MAKKKPEPHLIPDDRVFRCSVCKMPFINDDTLKRSFAGHLRMAHKPGQTSEDFSQAAVRIARETTEKS